MPVFTRIFLATVFGLTASVVIAAGKPVATVNGKNIDQKQYDQIVEILKSKNPQFDVETNRAAIINELVTREVMYQEAKKQKLDKIPDVAYVLEQQRIDTMTKALLRKFLDGTKVPDSELQKLYDEKIAKLDETEYKARHILLKTEDEAKAVIAELDAGKDFIELAKSKSTGPSAQSGGDLGWFTSGRMVPQFSLAVSGMNKGTYSKSPIQTKFGWHVIKLEDTRKLEPPKFDAVKPQLLKSIQQQRMQEYLKKLRSKAKVEIK